MTWLFYTVPPTPRPCRTSHSSPDSCRFRRQHRNSCGGQGALQLVRGGSQSRRPTQTLRLPSTPSPSWECLRQPGTERVHALRKDVPHRPPGGAPAQAPPGGKLWDTALAATPGTLSSTCALAQSGVSARRVPSLNPQAQDRCSPKVEVPTHSPQCLPILPPHLGCGLLGTWHIAGV